MEETIKCAPKIPINLLTSLNTDYIQLKDTLKKSGYKKLLYPFLTLPPPPVHNNIHQYCLCPQSFFQSFPLDPAPSKIQGIYIAFPPGCNLCSPCSYS